MRSPEVDARRLAQGRQRPRVVIRGSSFQGERQEVDEAILIEIATRFRKLEDAIEAADILHAERVERLTKKLDRIDDAYVTHQNYARFCREKNEAEKERNQVEESRQAIDKALESSRDDMVTMQEEIRKG